MLRPEYGHDTGAVHWTAPVRSRLRGHFGEPVPGLPFAAAILMLLIAATGEPARELLSYQREAVLTGEVWRLLTGHLVHGGWLHTAGNIAGLLLILGLFGRELDCVHLVAVGLLSAFVISLAMILWYPEVSAYVGLSGVLHGWLVFGAGRALAARQRVVPVLLLLLVLFKLTWEQQLGSLSLSGGFATGEVFVDAHLYGALVGLVCWWVCDRGTPFPR